MVFHFFMSYSIFINLFGFLKGIAKVLRSSTLIHAQYAQPSTATR